MEPCQFCGQQAPVDPFGFCTNCRNYRGTPSGPATAYPPAGPAYGQVSGPPSGPRPVSGSGGFPATGYPQPTSPSYGGFAAPQSAPLSAPPLSVPPQSGPPSYGAPQSAPPSYGATGFAPPQSAPPSYGMPQSAPPSYGTPLGTPTPPTNQRSPYLIPIIALCSVVALLAIGIVVVFVVRNSGGGSPTSSSSALIDECLVGRWKVTQYTTRIAFTGVGDVEFTGSDLNETIDIQSDGSTVDDYGTEGNPTVLTGTDGVSDYEIKIYGTVTFVIRSANGTLSFSEAHTDGKIQLSIDGTEATTIPLDVTNDPTPYTCGGGSFSQKTNDFSATAVKA